MKIEFKTFGILSIAVILGALLIKSNNIYATNQQCPIDVQILNSNDSWCSGTTEVGNETLSWDIISITSVTVGVANLDSAKHSLNQIILTMEKLSEDYGKKTENLTLDANLPLIISPRRYWEYDLSCPPCHALKISLEVDGEWFEFTPNQLLNDAGIRIGNTYWPSHWSKVSYYTESKITPINFLEIFTSVGLATIIFMNRRRRKREKLLSGIV